MGGESRSVNNALLTLEAGKNMGDYHQDMDYALYVLLKQTSDSLPATVGENFANDHSQGQKVQVLSLACHSHNLHNSARTTSKTTSDSCQWIPNGANKVQATHFTDLT